MTYPGNPELSAQAQERVMSAFRQAIAKIQDGSFDEALIGLEFVLRLDPAFAPGVALHKQLAENPDAIDLSEIISGLESPDTDAINLLLIEAVEDYNQHNYLEAKEKVERVLIDLPGHAEARSLSAQIDDALKVETQVGQFLAQAREALADNRPQDAANFVLMAQALDPHHSGIEATLEEIHRNAPQRHEDIGGFSPPTGAPAAAQAPDAGFSTRVDDAFQPPNPPERTEVDSWDIEDSTDGAAFDPGPKTADTDSFDFGGDVSDLFEASSDGDGPPPWESAAQPPSADDSAVADDLLTRGRAALDAGDPQEALHLLSRILLIDPDNPDVDALIDRARAAISVMEQRLQSSLSEAELAWDSGDIEQARTLIDELLQIDPGNADALALKERFEQGEEEPPPPPPTEAELPTTTLSDEQYVAASSSEAFDEFLGDSGELDLPPVPEPPPKTPTSGFRLPIRWVVLGAGALAIVLAGMWLGSRFLPGGDSDEEHLRALDQRIEEAQLLFDQGKGEEAIELLRSFPAEDVDRQRIKQHIARFEKALIPPTPTPIPESVERAKALLENGQWFEAYQVVTADLSKFPEDAGLLNLREQATTVEPRIVGLSSAVEKHDFQTCVGIAQDLVAKHPEQEGLDPILDACLFNAALVQLRSYNLTAARRYLLQLEERRPDDPEVSRIVEFISSYLNRPVDMQLEIFVGSLEFR